MIALHCGIQHYPWGQRATGGEKPFLAELLGLDPGNDEPFAELWMGAHPKLPAMALVDGRPTPLDKLIADHPGDILGRALVQRGVDRLPFLFKVLTCEQSLSIQAHPDLTRAAALHARDPQNYPDANHKPEIAIAIRDMTALCQFRPSDDIQRHIARLPALAGLLSGAAEGVVAGSKDWIKRLYERLFTASEADLAATLGGVDEQIVQRGAEDEADEWFARLAADHPGDRGALSVYFLNLVKLAAGEGMFLAPNEPHAYLKGVIVECMASSDNVVRAGLTPKFIDRETLIDMLTYRQDPPEIDRGDELAPGERLYRVPTPEFQIEIYRHGAGCARNYRADGAVSILLVLSGDATLRTSQGAVETRRGDVWLWPAKLAECDIEYRAPDTHIVRARPRMGN